MFDGNPTQYTVGTEPSLEGLLRFCLSKPADATYDWHDCNGGCLISQYATSIGLDPIADYVRISRFPTPYGDLGEIAVATPRTFGAAAARCRALLERPS